MFVFLCAEREPKAKFALPLNDRVGHNAVDA